MKVFDARLFDYSPVPNNNGEKGGGGGGVQIKAGGSENCYRSKVATCYH